MTSTPELLIRILFFVSLLAVIAGCEVPESAQTEGATIEQRDLPEQQTDSTPEMLGSPGDTNSEEQASDSGDEVETPDVTEEDETFPSQEESSLPTSQDQEEDETGQRQEDTEEQIEDNVGQEVKQPDDEETAKEVLPAPVKIFEPLDHFEPLVKSSTSRYALETQHKIGSAVYDRPRAFVSSKESVASRCKAYGDAIAAQQAFLDKGGPDVDPLRLDPDGDGFVCGWNPEPYRRWLK